MYPASVPQVVRHEIDEGFSGSWLVAAAVAGIIAGAFGMCGFWEKPEKLEATRAEYDAEQKVLQETADTTAASARETEREKRGASPACPGSRGQGGRADAAGRTRSGAGATSRRGNRPHAARGSPAIALLRGRVSRTCASTLRILRG